MEKQQKHLIEKRVYTYLEKYVIKKGKKEKYFLQMYLFSIPVSVLCCRKLLDKVVPPKGKLKRDPSMKNQSPI